MLARIRKRLREGFSVADLLACVEHALTDEWYSAKGYAKQPDVIWRDAGRVNGILERVSGPKARAQPRTRPGMLDGEALLAMAEEMGKAAKSREEGGNAASKALVTEQEFATGLGKIAIVFSAPLSEKAPPM